jgi:carbamoyl-phosphate synthase large subunit
MISHQEAMPGILVTGVGGGVGQSVLKCLQGSAYRLIGMDPDPLAAGLHAVPVAYQGQPAESPDFVDSLLDVCATENVSLIFPGVEPELLPLAKAADRFRQANVIPVVSTPAVIGICDDKLATARFLAESGFSPPATEAFTEDVDASWFPMVLKPQRGGARSQHTYVARDMEEFHRVRALIDPRNCVIQEYLDGDEFTAGTINWQDECHGSIVMRRTLRAGDTYKAFVVRDGHLERYVRDVAEALRPFGACNIQFRMRGDEPCVFEINARCSGTTYARALAGFNEPRMVADSILHARQPKYEIREIAILRYWSELVIEETRLAALGDTGRDDGPVGRL